MISKMMKSSVVFTFFAWINVVGAIANIITVSMASAGWSNWVFMFVSPGIAFLCFRERNSLRKDERDSQNI